MLQVPRPPSSWLVGCGPTRFGARVLVVILSLASLGLVACGGPPAPAASPSAHPTALGEAISIARATPTGEGCRKELAVVGNTNGLGVNLRKTPGGEVVKAFVEGTQLTICAENKIDDKLWYQVKTADGTEGWVLSTYAVPASEPSDAGR